MARPGQSVPYRELDVCNWVWGDGNNHAWANGNNATWHQCGGGMQMISGLAYAVSNRFTSPDTHPTGTHFHVANDAGNEGPPAIPIDNYVEAGGYFGDENIRGIIDFDLAGATTGSTCTLKFVVTDIGPSGLNIQPSPDTGGLYGQDHLGSATTEPYPGLMEVHGFTSDGVEALAKYSIASSVLGNFDCNGLTANQMVMFDITSFYNARVIAGDSFLGIRFQATPENDENSALVFEQFQLEVVS